MCAGLYELYTEKLKWQSYNYSVIRKLVPTIHVLSWKPFRTLCVTVDTCVRQRAVNRKRKQTARYKDVWASEGVVPPATI